MHLVVLVKTCKNSSLKSFYMFSLALEVVLGNITFRFVVIFGINTTSDVSKLFFIISRAVGLVKFGAILKYHEW